MESGDQRHIIQHSGHQAHEHGRTHRSHYCGKLPPGAGTNYTMFLYYQLYTMFLYQKKNLNWSGETLTPFVILFVKKKCNVFLYNKKNLNWSGETLTPSFVILFVKKKCNVFLWSNSRGSIKLADTRDRALCDSHAKVFFYLCSCSKTLAHPRQIFFPRPVTPFFFLNLRLCNARPTNTKKRPTNALKRPTNAIKRPTNTVKRPTSTL